VKSPRVPTLIPAITNKSFRTVAQFHRRNKRPKNKRETPAGFSYGITAGGTMGSPATTASGLSSTRSRVASTPIISAAASRPRLSTGGRFTGRCVSVARK
jgi:hypothetical protein